MRKRVPQQKMYYFSDRLKKQLDQIPQHPLTIVEAPSGFGKTTAVREYLKENLPAGACECWYTCLGEASSVAWSGICGLFANVSKEIAASLNKLEMPSKDMLLHLKAIIRGFDCDVETYLIIDNYHLFDCDMPCELMNVFSTHGSPNLHMIFITQQIETRQHFLIHSADIHIIKAPAFFFDRQGTAGLFRMEGIRLSEDELESVFMSTDGWIAALRLQIINYKETGTFNYSADIEQLVETAIWNRLMPEEKDFLLAISVMDSFTAQQAAVVLQKDPLPEHIRDMLKTNDFIRYFPDKGIYNIHSILQDYLRNHFYYYQPEDFQKRVLRLAGQACADAAQYCSAVRFFYKVKDFDAILSLPFSHRYLDQQKESYSPEISARILNECPDEIKCKYPYAVLLFGYRMLMHGQAEAYRELCRILELVIQWRRDLPVGELREIKGEYHFLKSYDGYNDLRKMHEGIKKAWEILGRPSKILTKEFPFAFGSTSLLGIHWRETGGLADTLRDMDEGFPYYLQLTRGHGSGADSILRAEAMLMRGEDDEAEILCHKALYDARRYQQTGMCLCAQLVLGRIAILRGDAEGYDNSINNIKEYAKKDTSRYILRMADACTSTLSLVLGSEDGVANWIWDMGYMIKTLYPPVIPFAQIYYSKLLLMEKRYNELYGFSRFAINMAENANYMMPQVYHRIFLSEAKRNEGRTAEAREHLKEALAMALPDKIYLPFAQEECMSDFLSEVIGYSCRDDGLAALTALCKRQAKGAGLIRKALVKAESPLTPREREIASLVKDRLSAKEIAEKLYISERTVKSTLSNIYGKLEIHSRAELNSKEF